MLTTTPRRGVSRRDFCKLSAAGISTLSLTGWLPVLAAGAQEQPKPKACIVLWMDGGPPHTDTFDMKPDNLDGAYQPIATAVPGIHISELLPRFARLTQHAAIIRGMSTVENEHFRGRYHLRTGYRDGQGGISYPSLGAIVAKELADLDAPVPNYVAVNGQDRSHGPGYLGSAHQPLFVRDPNKGVENLQAAVAGQQFGNRLALLDQLEQSFTRSHQPAIGSDHRHVYARAVQLMKTDKVKAFDLNRESAALRAAYGDNPFGQGCLLARRLVETGVKFIEVGLGGWDTHFENNNQVKKLCGQLDPAMSTLVQDLRGRGLFESTLIVWMGEFGRSPKMKKPNTRDHYARAWSTVLMGGGIRAGQVVGKTDQDGATVVDRPVSVADFMATICRVLGIKANKRNVTPGGRPISLIEKGANPIEEILP